MSESEEEFAWRIAEMAKRIARDGPVPRSPLSVTANPPAGYQGHLHGMRILVPDPYQDGIIREAVIAAVHEEVLPGTPNLGQRMEWKPGMRPSDGRPDTGPGAAWLALIPEGLPAEEYGTRRSSLMSAYQLAQGPEGSLLREKHLNSVGRARSQVFRMRLAELATRAFPTDRDAYLRFTKAIGLEEPLSVEPEAPPAEVGGVLSYSDIATELTRIGYMEKEWTYRAVYARITSREPRGVFKEFLRARLRGGKFDRSKTLALLKSIEERVGKEAEEAEARLKAEQARKVAEERFARRNSPLQDPQE